MVSQERPNKSFQLLRMMMRIKSPDDADPGRFALVYSEH